MALRFLSTLMAIGICATAVFSVYENSRAQSGYTLAAAAPDLADVAVGTDRGGRSRTD